MGTIDSLTTTANEIAALLNLAVEPLNEKLKQTSYRIVFHQVTRGGKKLTEPFLVQGIWRSEISLTDEDMPKLLTMNADDIIKYLKS